MSVGARAARPQPTDTGLRYGAAAMPSAGEAPSRRIGAVGRRSLVAPASVPCSHGLVRRFRLGVVQATRPRPVAFRPGIGPLAHEANSRNRLNVISFAGACFRSFPADLIRAIRYTVRPSRGRFRNPLFLEKLEER